MLFFDKKNMNFSKQTLNVQNFKRLTGINYLDFYLSGSKTRLTENK